MNGNYCRYENYSSNGLCKLYRLFQNIENIHLSIFKMLWFSHWKKKTEKKQQDNFKFALKKAIEKLPKYYSLMYFL